MGSMLGHLASRLGVALAVWAPASKQRSVVAAFLAIVLHVFGCARSAPLPPQAVAMNRAGVEALGAGDLELARTRVDIAIAYHPKFTEAWVNRGLVDLRAGNFDAAYASLKRARSLNPDVPAPHHALALLEEARGRVDKARRHYRDALAVDPGFFASRVNLGRLAYARGDYEEAREAFLAATETSPDALTAHVGLIESLLKLGRHREADRATLRARERFGDVPELALLVGRQLLRRGTADRAASIFEELTRLGDSTFQAAAWAWLGVARLHAKDDAAAIRAANEALRRERDHAVARFVVAQAGKNQPRAPTTR